MKLALRTILTELDKPEAAALQWIRPTQAVYKLCQSALEVSSIAQITQLMLGLESTETLCAQCVIEEAQSSGPDFYLTDLVKYVSKLKKIMETLRAYERVETPADKMAYLVSTVENLSKV